MSLQILLWSAFLSVAFCLPTKLQRLSLAEWGSYNFRDHKGPGTYAFGYDVEDAVTQNIQFRQEERHRNGSVTGSYGYVQPNGKVRITHYIADAFGYRVHEETLPSLNYPAVQEIVSPPPNQQDEQIFEGEFHPVSEDLENDLDYNENPHPVLFPLGLHKQHSPLSYSKIIPTNFLLGEPKTMTATRGQYYYPTQGPTLTYYNSAGFNGGSVKFRVP